MKKTTSLITLLTIILLSFNLLAEEPNPTSIKGKVIDKGTNAPLEYATVGVYNMSDSTLVTGVVTDLNGGFSIDVNPGKYYVTVQFIGYLEKTVNNVEVKQGGGNVQLGKIVISPDSELLDEVEVVAEKSSMVMTLDKRVFNVGKDVSNTAGNAIEVLENIPSVEVDVEGNVSLRGDEGVQILVDGKVSGLVGVSTSDALRSLQADMIERVEVVTNPSVRYDAEGTAGIINIVLKKDKRRGFNGSVDLRGGFPFEWGKKMDTDNFPFQAGIGTSLNFRLKRFNIFANYNFNYRDDISDGYTKTEYFEGEEGYNPDLTNHGDATEISEQITERNRNRKGHNIRGGLDYYITDDDILSFSAMFRQGTGHNTPIVTYVDRFPFENKSDFSKRMEDWHNNRPMQEYTLSYDKFFGSKENSLKSSFRYFTTDEHEWSDIIDAEYLTQEDMDNDIRLSSLSQYTDTDEKEHNIQGNVDYVQHFGTIVVEAGGKYTNRMIDNKMIVKQADTIWNEYSHDFEYDQQVAAAYGIFGKDFGHTSIQIGARYEYTYVFTNLKDTGEKNEQKYHNLFPSGHFNYKLTEEDQLQVSYARRIRRPGYWQMSPFHSFNDDRNIRSGNPALKPIFTDSYELTYLHFWKKGNFNLTGYYRHSTDVIRHFTTVVGDVSYSRPENFGISDDYGIELVGSIQLFKWWSLNGNINFFKSVTVGNFNDRHYLTDSYNMMGRLVSKFTFKKICDVQITGRYRGPRDEPLGYRDASYWADFAASRDIMKGKATISLNVRDVFGSRQHGGESWGDNFWQYSEGSWSKTTVTVNFNYRFNQQGGDKKKGHQAEEGNGGEGFEENSEY